VAGREVDAGGDVEAAMTETLAEPGPALLRVRIDLDDDCLPMFAPGGAAREMMGLSPARQPPRVVVGPAGRS
jgi:acetolactate synthase I/II/III large subunit